MWFQNIFHSNLSCQPRTMHRSNVESLNHSRTSVLTREKNPANRLSYSAFDKIVCGHLKFGGYVSGVVKKRAIFNMFKTLKITKNRQKPSEFKGF